MISCKPRGLGLSEERCSLPILMAVLLYWAGPFGNLKESLSSIKPSKKVLKAFNASLYRTVFDTSLLWRKGLTQLYPLVSGRHNMVKRCADEKNASGRQENFDSAQNISFVYPYVWTICLQDGT